MCEFYYLEQSHIKLLILCVLLICSVRQFLKIAFTWESNFLIISEYEMVRKGILKITKCHTVSHEETS